MTAFQVGEVIPGYCGGQFSIDTMGETLRVEGVGVDWVVLRGERGEVHFYAGSHEDLRRDAEWARRDAESVR